MTYAARILVPTDFSPLSALALDHTVALASLCRPSSSRHARSPGLAHLMLGSVAEQVVRTAPCPVLIVRERVQLPAEARGGSLQVERTRPQVRCLLFEEPHAS